MEIKTTKEELIKYADILKALAHPVRLCIVKGLIENGPHNVSDMHSCLDMAQSTVSQHLGKLKSAGILSSKREGTEIIYSVNNKFVEGIIKNLDV
ncbi:ArsR/SmtB family transcription factor [Peptostreptococcus equinus]|uniref:Metalloregulator ArsR/SmtB family transcription factor n=1 Tax=Peptostreptococcus equinus TaxID=3003601 RepID=A0ABY7JT53_9FIRM|nr:metalloregulator ArsR/SmtB family transcription factor [Peptostreptococcus sp. CBA3647]WAW15107.1 metalloregulator ArsR/SmtB family transcription factor [Peptostreptococcus sp. CBA3647]